MDKAERRSIIGWNWGYYTLEDDDFRFDVKGAHCFSFPYTGINLATATNKNEVAIELDIDHVKDDDKGDYLTEFRFFLPDNEADEKDESAKDEESNGEGEEDEEEKGEIKEPKNKDDSKSPAQLLADKIIK